MAHGQQDISGTPNLTQQQVHEIKNFCKAHIDQQMEALANHVQEMAERTMPAAGWKNKAKQVGFLGGVAVLGGVVGAAVAIRYNNSKHRKLSIELETTDKEVDGRNKVRPISTRASLA